MAVKSCSARKHTFRLPVRARTAFDVIALAFQEDAQPPALRRGGREAETRTVTVETQLRRHIRLPEAASPRSSHLCLLWQVDPPHPPTLHPCWNCLSWDNQKHDDQKDEPTWGLRVKSANRRHTSRQR